MSKKTRYSDAELEEFKALIEEKMASAIESAKSLESQIQELTEETGAEFGIDFGDDSNINDQREMLMEMLIRQKKYIRELERALVRIKNKTYGICEVTGELIDKRRLMAVPTTTKSMTAKNIGPGSTAPGSKKE